MPHRAEFSHSVSMSRPVVLVTGASRGLGRGVALTLAREGYDLAIHYATNRAAADEAVELCREAAPDSAQRFFPVAAQLASASERSAMIESVLAEFGHLDALVNNAGIAPRVRNDITEADEENFDEVIAVNLRGPYFLSQLAARWWLAHPGQSRLPGGYKLVFVTSISVHTASVNRGEYCIAKAGLAMASQLWSVRLAGEGVQVYEVRPGIMKTDMTAGVTDKYDKLIAEGLVPQKRWGTPEDVGLAVRALCRGDFPFSTGTVIDVDGGFQLRRL
jgi:NAD(P)-dependent dehydrogenase (short-subunit alcohol dehydrogenase family)